MEVPNGCAERMEFIEYQAKEMGVQFYMGNRSCVFEKLIELPQAVSLAIVASMVESMPPAQMVNLASYLREMA